MSFNKTNSSKTFLILTLSWMSLALLTTIFFLSASLSTKDTLNYFATNGLVNNRVVGITTYYLENNNGSVVFGAMGIIFSLFFAITIITFIPLVIAFIKVKPDKLNVGYFTLIVSTSLFALVFTAIISYLGSPYTVKQLSGMRDSNVKNSPIISNMITSSNSTNSGKVFSLGGGSISILLVDIVSICMLLVWVANFILKYKEANQQNNQNDNNIKLNA